MPSDPSMDGYVWTPDLYILEDNGSKLKYNDLLVSYNGSVFYETSGEIRVAFNPDVFYFPYDD